MRLYNELANKTSAEGEFNFRGLISVRVVARCWSMLAVIAFLRD